MNAAGGKNCEPLNQQNSSLANSGRKQMYYIIENKL